MTLISEAQSPSYISLGTEELKDVEIYDVFLDKEDLMWLATSNGIILFDGYSFKNIPSQNLQSNSLFAFTRDRKDQLYCFNLNGEVCQVGLDSVKIHYAIPDSLLGPEISIQFDPNNNLIVSSKKVIRVAPDKTTSIVEVELNGNRIFPSEIGIHKDGSCFIKYGTRFYWIQDSSAILIDKYNAQLEKYAQIITLNGHPYITSLTDKQLYKVNKGSLETIFNLKNTEIGRIQTISMISENEYWIRLINGKIYRISIDGSETQLDPFFEHNTKIGKIYKDSDQGYWLSTLGENLLYIRNLDLLNLTANTPLKNISPTCVKYDAENNLVIGTKEGEVFYVTGTHTSIIKDIKSQSINLIECYKDTIYFQEHESFVKHNNNKNYKIKKFSTSIKDIIILPNQYHLATRSNAIIHHLNTKERTVLMNGRTECIYFDQSQNLHLLGGRKGLIRRVNNNTTKINLNGQPIQALDFASDNSGNVYVATNKAILQYKNDTLSNFLTTKDGLLDNNIHKIIFRNDTLFIGQQKGIQIYDLTDKTFRNITSTDGIYDAAIQDFDIKGGKLAVATSLGVQELKLQNIKPLGIPKVFITEIVVNDHLYKPEIENIFPHISKKFTFSFRSPEKIRNNNIEYEFMIENVDEQWQKTPFNQNSITYNALSPGSYVFKVRSISNYHIRGETATFKFEIEQPIWFRWWFIISVLLLLTGILYVLYRVQLSRIKLRNQQKNELMSSKLTAIQSQMNPHFIFNALNSIQDLVLKEDIDNSYKYIVKFSNLLRSTLSHSDKEFIEFESEVKLITLYLQLEKLRFKTNFEYEVITNEIEDILVPPLLVQPFIENALKHGLLHKDQGLVKKLRIEFKLEHPEILMCTIEDNGIGRVKSSEIKARQQLTHESFSSKAIKSRLEILQEHYKLDVGIDYEDLYDGKTPTGTRVRLRIPCKPKY